MQDRIFMENVGAVKELSKITSDLEARIIELEQTNERYSLLKKNNPAITLSDLSCKCIDWPHELIKFSSYSGYSEQQRSS